MAQIATEQTTAFTDLILGILSLICCMLLKKTSTRNRIKQKIWLCFFLFLSLASFLGALAHGVEMSSNMKGLLWHPLYLFLALSVAFFVMGAIFEIRSERNCRSIISLMISVAFLFFLITVFIPESFLVFIIYEGFCLLVCLVIFLFKLFRTRQPSYLFMIAGIMLTILAAVLQSMQNISFHFIWEFDHNGIFHLVQIPALILIFISVRKLLKDGISDH